MPGTLIAVHEVLHHTASADQDCYCECAYSVADTDMATSLLRPKEASVCCSRKKVDVQSGRIESQSMARRDKAKIRRRSTVLRYQVRSRD